MITDMRRAAEMPDEPAALGSLVEALRLTEDLVVRSPALAVEQAEEILKVVPDHSGAALLLGRALRLSGRPSASRAWLEQQVDGHPTHALMQVELATSALALADTARAISALEAAVEIDPDILEAWTLLADLHSASSEDDSRAVHARAQAMRLATSDPVLIAAALALCDDKLDIAERALRSFLKRTPTNTAAIRMLAEVAARIGRYEDSAILLEDALAIDPAFDEARANYAQVLQRQGRAHDALPQIELLLARHPQNPGWRNIKAAVLVNLGRYAPAIHIYAGLLAERPHMPKGWLNYGHALKTVGRQQEAVDAYRTAIAQQPALGEAWWSLANLKTHKFSDDDVVAMQGALQAATLAPEDELHLQFALGKAFEDAGADAPAFDHYRAGNAIRKAQTRYDRRTVTAQVARTIATTPRKFFEAQSAGGCAARDPIFILGMPRAGSTLVEQILSSHSLVEGTMELPDISAIARRLGGIKARDDRSRYPEVLTTLSAQDRTALGEEYLERTRAQRQTEKPYFIDKMPNNWLHVALIRAILPNATIIDARRHPMACCWSVYKQHFARGQAFSYDLHDLGAYYCDYVAMMAHLDAVQPGAVHRVVYEDMVADSETEIRRLLEHCGLPFELACLEYWRNQRAVRTASSEQVRQPIFKNAVDHWRRFEPMLGELAQALAPVLERMPET